MAQADEAVTAGKLSAVAVRQSPAGKYGDGNGLWLVKTGKSVGNWVLRFTVHGKMRYMGLGSIADVSLSEARREAARWRSVVRTGSDPIAVRAKELREAASKARTLEQVAKEAFDARKASLKGEGKAGRWYSPIEQHLIPKLGTVPIADISQMEIRDTLAPIWKSKADTAQKALTRLRIVFMHAAALGLDVDLNAVDKAKALLGESGHRTTNIPSMPWRDVPDFYRSLDDGTVTHLALRLLILTGVRSRPLRFLKPEQIEGDVWTIPAAMMKATVKAATDFRVPLSTEALSIIEAAMRHQRDGWIFPSVRKGVLSDATMIRLMERRKLEARPHGFRSSLRDWLAETTDAPHAVAETVLAHKVGSTVQQAYLRTDFLDQRRVLMERWGNFVAGRPAQQ